MTTGPRRCLTREGLNDLGYHYGYDYHKLTDDDQRWSMMFDDDCHHVAAACLNAASQAPGAGMVGREGAAGGRRLQLAPRPACFNAPKPGVCVCVYVCSCGG